MTVISQMRPNEHFTKENMIRLKERNSMLIPMKMSDWGE